MTELELHQQPANDLSLQMDYARAVSSAALLPQAYRGKPADIMLAVGLGQAMGLSPAESLYRIDVIQGKPTASAELIAANVRKAGHKLRVRGDEQSCTATIIRADDPDFEFTVTRDKAWAQAMGLTSKDNYKKQPGTMLQWRAITAVARLACPEALYGVAYTADEIADSNPRPSGGGLSAALNVTAEQVTPEPSPAQVAAEQSPEGSRHAQAESAGQPDAMSRDGLAGESPLLNTSSKLAKAMYAGINEAGIPEADRLAFISEAVGREVASSKELTEDEARKVLDFLPGGAA